MSTASESTAPGESETWSLVLSVMPKPTGWRVPTFRGVEAAAKTALGGDGRDGGREIRGKMGVTD